MKAVGVADALVAHVDVTEASTVWFDDAMFLVNVDGRSAPLALTAETHDAGVAEVHVWHLACECGLARIANAGWCVARCADRTERAA